MGKPVIAVPRWSRNGEHNDDHQLEIVRQFHQAGHILYWDEGMDFQEVFERALTFSPKPYESGRDKIIGIIDDFIQSSGKGS